MARQSSSSYKWTYDVFLSFRGEDTRKGFTGNLHEALRLRGIHTFMDDARLRGGEEITPSLVKAIEESRIAIVVFSENYASSRFCLEELVKIIDCIKTKGQLVLPVFYKVDPSQVRHQTGSYGKAFARYDGVPYHEPEKVQKWRSALSKAANLSGYHYYGLEYECVFIGKVIEEVSSKIKRIPLYIADYPVGLESRVLEVNSLLDVGSDDGVNMVGIYGIGGIGKSTIARAVYNSIAHGFEGLCFLSNVREKSMKQGLAQLQETLLFELTGEGNIKFGDINQGIPILKRRLNQKKVLLVLDDIDEQKQLQALAGGVDWFGSGSRIIITTRDRHLLDVHCIKRQYPMKELNHKEAHELFKWKAFKGSKADSDFQAILERAVRCGHDLPLALEVIGSNLYGKTIDEWNAYLDKYEENSDEHVQKVLKVSYNSLKQEEREIFLDFACFFNGEILEYVKKILFYSRGSSPDYVIGVLIAKSLIKITESELVEIHHLIQDMGRKIVEEESPLEPGRCSRLWFCEDIIHVLEDNTGTDNIQFIKLDAAKLEVEWSGDEFKKMRNLRVLIIKDANFSQVPKYLPNSLRVLCWERYPSSALPFEFRPRKLVILNLSNSIFRWDKALKKFEQLKEINFEGCKFLKQVPDLSNSPNLTKLYLDNCKNLTEIHDSVGFLEKLSLISAVACVNLKILPHFRKLKSLKTLNLMFCSSLQNFPQIFGNKENLSHIFLGSTAIEELPCSIQRVTGLNWLDLSFCQRLKKVPTCILMLPNFKTLEIRSSSRFQFKKRGEKDQVISTEEHICLGGYNFLDGFLPTFLGCFPNMTSLELCGSNLTILPECIQACQHLSDLNLDNCKQLQEIRAIPPNIKVLSAINCTSLNPSALNLLLDKNIHSRGNTCFTLPGKRIPKWFDCYDIGNESLLFWFRNEFPDIALFFVGASNEMFDSLLIECILTVNDRVVGEWYSDYPVLETKHTFLYDLRSRLNLDMERKVYSRYDIVNYVRIHYVFNTYGLGGRTKLLLEQWGFHIYDRARIQDVRF